MAHKPPFAFRKIYSPKPDENFKSLHLSAQSQIDSSDESIHLPVLASRFSDRLSHVNTLYGVFKNGLNISRESACLGSRVSTEVSYKWCSYADVDRDVQHFGSSLITTVGHDALTDNFVGIYSKNSLAWVVTQLACSAYSYVYVPLYETLGKDALQHILDQTQLKVLVCHQTKEAVTVLKDLNAPSVKCVVITVKDEAFERLKEELTGEVSIFSFDEFLDLGGSVLKPMLPAKPDDLCTLCYTSGSTGIPKGVMLTQRQLAGVAKSMLDLVEGKFFNQVSVHYSYLPLAHIYEQAVLAFVFLGGARAAFTTSGRLSLLDDLQDVRPTFLAAVPRVLCMFYTEFFKKIPNFRWLRRHIAKTVERKLKLQARGNFENSGLVDHLLFSRVRKMFGNRVCGVVCAGAPLVEEISRFIRAALSCPVLESYGATETSGPVTISLVGDPTFGIVGTLSPDVQIKLVDVPEMGISVAQDGLGEICVRGYRMTQGYYKDPESTSKLRDSDGFIHLGDLGGWSSNGALVIKDRCKNMFKLAQGEYIAPEKVEDVYHCCPLIVNALLDGTCTETFAVVVVYPDFTRLRSELSKHAPLSGLKKEADEKLCANLAVRKFVLNEMDQLAREHGLISLERAKSIYLTSEPFTIANGLLTPTLKVARYRARMTFKTKIAEMYQMGPII